MRRTLLLIALFPGLALGQTPDRRGEIAISEPSYRGVDASAPIPVELHVRNEGGSNGAGLCVISSAIAAGMAQGVPGLAAEGYDEASGENRPGKGSRLWKAAKARPGGYSPDKLAALLNEVMPGEKWVSYVGTDPLEIEKLVKAGYRVCSTMNTGQQYGYRGIHHFVNDIHYETNGWACVVDNNDPGKFHWMPATERARRFIDGGTLWAFAWLKRPIQRRFAAALLFLASSAMIGGAALILVTKIRGPNHDRTPARARPLGQLPGPGLHWPRLPHQP